MADSLVTVDKSKVLLVRGGVAVAAIAVLALVLPVIYAAFLSTLGLIGIGILGIVGFGMIKSMDLIGQKMENSILKLRKAEARANPIEQLENNLILKAGQLRAFKSGLEQIGSQIASLESSLKEQARKDPNDDLTEQWQAVKKMQLFYEHRKQRYTEAFKALEDYKKSIERAKFKYGFGTAAQGIAQSMNDNDSKNLMENMLADEAFKSVDLRFNSAFAALDLDSAELNSSQKLEFGSGLVIDVNAIQIPDAVAVRKA